MRKRWFSIKLSGGMIGTEILDKALDRATSFVNQHALHADDFKIELFESCGVLWAIVFYCSEHELEYIDTV